jgi:hypothetical protein
MALISVPMQLSEEAQNWFGIFSISVLMASVTVAFS